MFQNDNVTNDLIHGLVNDHGFEDTTISSVKTFICNFSKQFRDTINNKSVELFTH